MKTGSFSDRHSPIWPALVLAVVCCASAGSTLWAQDTSSAPPAPTPTPAPTPIPAAEIPSQSGVAATTLKDIAARAETIEDITKIEGSLEAERRKIDALEKQTEADLKSGAARSSLEEMEKEWLREGATLATWQATLQSRAELLAKNLEKTGKIKDLWQLTLDSAAEQEMPTALKGTVRDVLRMADQTRGTVNARRDHVLTLQTEVSKLQAKVSDILVPIRTGIKEQSRSMLIPSQPPIWRTPWQPPGDASLSGRVRAARLSDYQTIKTYLENQTNKVMKHATVFGVCFFVFLILSRRAKEYEGNDPSFKNMALLLMRPVASAVLISTLVEDWIHPQAPAAWSDFLAIVSLVALFRLLPPILPSKYRGGLLILVALFLFERLVVLVPQEAMLYRIGMLVLALGTAATMQWVVRKAGDPAQSSYPRWFRVATGAFNLATGMMVIAAVAEIIGSVDLAEVLVHGVLVCIYYGVLLWTGTLVVRGAIAALLSSPSAQQFNMVKLHSDTIQSSTNKAIDFVAVIGWFNYALHGFGLRSEAYELISKASTAEITVFGQAFNPYSAIPVIIAVWLTFKVSKFVNFVLADDVLPKFSLPRGVPNTILRITHYLILTIGFFVIVSMLGLDLTKFTIIAGALSVGIGFGMQNIVNNFVSGLILLFERPIKEGDKIQVGSVSGQVERIGTRASIVRTWQGAEVIVPNADLISEQVVNWTLYDLRRRIEIPIGTAYGSDPEAVMQLLLKVATDHPHVLSDPAPAVPFMGFGASSLDFEVRAWTLDDIVALKSDLAVAMNRALADAGIEIPFPQRDIHLRQGPETSLPAQLKQAGAPQTPSAAKMAADGSRKGSDPEGTSGPEMDLGGDDGGGDDGGIR